MANQGRRPCYSWSLHLRCWPPLKRQKISSANVVQWSHKLGRATEVKAYIGYKGRDAVNDPNVQFRTGKRIVTTEGWLKTRGTKSFDVGFIQVNKPFTGILPIKYEETPVNGEFELGVVGYPGDLTDKQTGEKGAFMYEMFLPVSSFRS